MAWAFQTPSGPVDRMPAARGPGMVVTLGGELCWSTLFPSAQSERLRLARVSWFQYILSQEAQTTTPTQIPNGDEKKKNLKIKKNKKLNKTVKP